MSTSSEPLRRRGAALEAAVLGAAAAELAERGTDASVADVAARAGVNRTSIYRRYGTRENLFVQALVASSRERVPVPNTGTLRGDLVAVLEQTIAGLADPLGMAFLRTSALLQDPGYTEARRQFWQTRFEAFVPMLDRAIDRGEVRRDIDRDLALELLIAPLHSRLLVTGLELEIELAERIVDLVVRGLDA